ncbi:hypothetical protein D770_26595 [Flammeovirgaceae bacterium 311]|nr:hypothetical protein D770_26595 [Flammeovirgaceae bacterium 311]
MKNICLSVLITFIFFSCSKKDHPIAVVPGEVFINEIQASGDDWIELYNSSGNAVNIGGYAVYDSPDKKFILPAGTNIPANGYLLLYCDGLATGLHTNFKLAVEGETVYLENASGTLTDMVTYSPLGENQTYGRVPDGSENFVTFDNPSPGYANGNTSGAFINDVSRRPLVPRPDDAVTISVSLDNVQSATAVNLYHKKDNGSFSMLPMTAMGEGVYEATIPKLNGPGTISYYVEVSNGQTVSARFPITAPQEPLQYLITTDELPQLFINEFMAANQSCCTDPAGEEEHDDWIEIYNGGSQAVNLAGMYISDNQNNPFKYKIPADNSAVTTIPAGGFLVIWADEQAQQGPLHANFKLAADGEDIGLYYIDGRTIDELTYGTQAVDVSRGRMPDGGTTWSNFTDPSPGEANQ